jgi:peptidyl-prolyl cis-trans isomerase SurA
LVLGLVVFGALFMSAACTRKDSAEREIWANVDGQPIYRGQVEKIYRSRNAASSDPVDADQALSFKLNILDELINNQVLLAHASHSGIAVSEAEVDKKIAELESPYSKEEFQKKLTEQGMDSNDLRQGVRQTLILAKLINKEISSRVSVSGPEIAAYYEHNKANFNVSETQYHLSQIEVTPVADPEVRNLKNDDAKSPVAADRKIQALYARLRAGEDFAVVAQEYSEDPRTAAGGGDMGFVPTSALESSPPLKQAVKSLKVGDISGIVHTPEGYHIIKLLGVEEAGQHPLSDAQVQSTIRQTLMGEKEQLLKTAYIEVQRNRAKVDNFLAAKIVGTE